MEDLEGKGSESSSGKWIKGAIKRKGELHRDLGVPANKRIPESKLKKAEHMGGKVGKRARLAETLKSFHK